MALICGDGRQSPWHSPNSGRWSMIAPQSPCVSSRRRLSEIGAWHANTSPCKPSWGRDGKVPRRVWCWLLMAAGLVLVAPPGKVSAGPPAAGVSRGGKTSPAAPVAASELAVDVVELTDGSLFRGLVLHRIRRGDGVVAVEREWLRGTHSDLLRKLEAEEVQTVPQAWQQLLERLQEWRAEPDLSPKMMSFLDGELNRARQAQDRWRDGTDPAAVPQFVVVEWPAPGLRSLRLTTPQHRQLALLAWRENLADVSLRKAGSLDQELRHLGFDPGAERVNLSDRLPVRRQSNREWQARRAILGYTQQQPLDFQGTATRLMRTGPEAPAANAAELLAAALQAQLSQTLSDLLNPDVAGAAGGARSFAESALAQCRRQARQLQLAGYRATAVQLDAATGQSRVDCRFDVLIGPQEWVTAWQAGRQSESVRATPEARQRLREDPQVRGVLDLLAQSGLADDEAVAKALDVGLATQQLQQDLDAEFRLFLGHYGVHPEGPPLFLPEPVLR